MSNPDQTNREKEIFEAALDRAPGEERRRFLEGACGNDTVLLARIQALLRADEAGEDFLSEQPRETKPIITEKPGDQIGPYRLLQQIGEGGCGVVYMAEQEAPVRRRVALKIIKAGMDTRRVIARFEAERQALALMDHMNIAKVLEAGATATGRPYFVMELVGGVKITDYCEENDLTTRQRLDLFIQVCRAIQHAHQKGVIHRDIKPSNVLVAIQDGVAVPKVIDFGIAKATQGHLTDDTVFTAFEQFLGTPAYMSPEQAQLGGVDVDTRSDIYSLGVLLYELLTGKTPFDAKELLAAGLDAMRRTILEKEPPTPSTRLKQGLAARAATSDNSDLRPPTSDLDRDLDWIVMRCLEKERARRYETANGLARDVERHLNNEPVAASPPSNLYRFQKLVRRNRVRVATAASIALVLMLGVFASGWQAVRATRAEREQSRLSLEARQQQQKEAQLRRAGEERLYDSLAAQAQALRIARQSGYRAKVLELLRQANALPVPQRDLSMLQREALACMGDFVGLTPTVITVATNKALISRLRLDPTCRLAAFLLSDRTIVFYHVPDGDLAGVLKYKVDLPIVDFCFDWAGKQIISVHWPTNELSPQIIAKAQVRFWRRDANGQWEETRRVSVPGAWSCCATSDGNYAATWDLVHATIKLVRLDPVQEVGSFEFDSVPCPNCFSVDLSPDGKKLALSLDKAVSSESGTQTVIDLWDTESSRHLQRWTSGVGRVQCLSFNEDGKYLGCLGSLGAVVYSVDGTEPGREYHEYFELNSQVAFVPKRSLVALPLIQQWRIGLWDWAKYQEIASFDSPFLKDVAVAPNGKFVIGYNLKQARLYPLETADGKLRLAGHPSAVTGLAFCPDGSRLASVGKDRKLIIWDTDTGSKVWESETLPGPGQAVAYSPDGTLLVTGDADTRLVQIRNGHTGELMQELGTKEDGFTWCTEFSRDGHYLAVSTASNVAVDDSDSWIHVWEVNSKAVSGQGSVVVKLLKSIPGHFRNLKFSPDGRTLAFHTRTKNDQPLKYEAMVWEFQTYKAPRSLRKFTSSGAPYCLSFSPDDYLLLWSSLTMKLEKVDVKSGNAAEFFGGFAMAQRPGYHQGCHCLSPDGGILMQVQDSGLSVDLWDIRKKSLMYSLPEENGSVYFPAWSPDGRRLAISRSNGDIAIWSLDGMAHFVAQLESPTRQ